LLRPAEINELKASLIPEVREPSVLASRLIERGWLSRYEAEQLLEGRHQELDLRPYRLLGLVGEGGLCQVFKAWNSETHSVAALKIVHADLRSNRDVLQQLRQEFQVLARLSHPCFVKVFDVDANVERAFFAMEFVDGIDLSRLLQWAGPLPAAQACEYVRQVASGLQYAYERGLVHRDIKPANLLAPFQGHQVRILDIGISRLEWSSPEGAAADAPGLALGVLGTPDYLAPEQALNYHQADIRSDIYSLGCTLYQLLTGQPPFPGKSLSKKLQQHQQALPPSIRALRPELPEELAAVVQRMMAKAPRDRYQTPAGVRVALARFCNRDGPPLSLERYRQHLGEFDCPFARPWPHLQDASTATRSGNQAETRTPAELPVIPAPPAPEPGRPDFKERRKGTRRHGNPVSVQVMPLGGGHDPISGWVLNRSSGGLGLLLDEAVEIGTVVNVHPARFCATQFAVPVHVCSCNAERGSWRVGCRFVEPQSHAQLRLFG
jgi:serine/threonine protein kinase